MSIDDISTVFVEKIVPGGDGLAVNNGKKVFIPLSAPGDRLKARITEDHGSWMRAEILEIIDYSACRIEPDCPQYGVCGGCSLQHLSYQMQLSIKKAILDETLAHAVKTGKGRQKETLPSITVIPGKPWETRNRVSFHSIKSNTFPRCGLKARRSGEVVPLEDCPAAASGIRRIMPQLLPPPGKDRFTLYSKDQTTIAETGTSRGTITLLNREITLDACSFFQSNAGVLESLVKELRIIAEKKACKTGTMADLYAGVGTLSMFIADLFPKGVDLVEADSRALELAKINLSSILHTGTACRFFSKKVEEWAKKRNTGSYSLIVADPPRQGLPSALVTSLCNSPPPVFVYVSCNPATFARDFRMLTKSFSVESLFLFDFYPQTAHIEIMGTFIRK